MPTAAVSISASADMTQMECLRAADSDALEEFGTKRSDGPSLSRRRTERTVVSRPQCDAREGVVPISDRPDETGGPEDPGAPEEQRGPPSAEEVSDEISREILRIHEESYGAGAREAHTFLDGDFVVVILDDPELLPNEAFLIENGRHETVTQVRSQYQLAIRATFTAAIERATGRSVVGFASTTAVGEPKFVAEVFKLD